MHKQPDNQAEAEAIYKKAIAAAKKLTKYVAYTDLDLIDGEYVITIETDIPEGVGDATETIIKKSKRGIYLRVKAFEGSFDWASDTYIKDAILIYFKF